MGLKYTYAYDLHIHMHMLFGCNMNAKMNDIKVNMEKEKYERNGRKKKLTNCNAFGMDAKEEQIN